MVSVGHTEYEYKWPLVCDKSWAKQAHLVGILRVVIRFLIMICAETCWFASLNMRYPYRKVNGTGHPSRGHSISNMGSSRIPCRQQNLPWLREKGLVDAHAVIRERRTKKKKSEEKKGNFKEAKSTVASRGAIRGKSTRSKLFKRHNHLPVLVQAPLPPVSMAASIGPA